MAEPVKVTVEDENGHTTEFAPVEGPHHVIALSVAPISETLARNQTRQLIATCTLADRTREDCTTHVDTSYSSNNLAVATVTAGGLVQVTATAAAGASATIMVMHQGFMANYSVTVSGVVPPRVMTSITVTPDSVALNVGDLRQLMATCFFNDGTSEDCTTESAWVSANPGVATVTPNGGMVTGKAAGNAVIEARHSEFMDSSSFTVTQGPVTNLPDPPAGAIFITGNQPNGINISSGHYVIQGTVTCPAKSVVVTGTAKLWMRGKYKSDLYYTGINNAAFKNDGSFAPVTDIGLWVEGAGSIDFRGTPKKRWGYGLSFDPSWQLGDETVEGPMSYAEIGPNGFKPYQPGSAIRVMPNGQLLPIFNLTCDIKMRGEPGKFAHYRNTSTAVSFTDDLEVSWFGPPGPTGSGFLGRYPIHHHMRHESSRGHIARRVVVKHSGQHAFVPHMSYGITFVDCIGYDVKGDVYWYDPSPRKVEGETAAQGVERRRIGTAIDPTYRGCVAAWTHHRNDGDFQHAGFLLAKVKGGVVDGCLTIGIGGKLNSSGYHWSEGDSNVEDPSFWQFDNNAAIANANWATHTWQNSGPVPHTVASAGKFTSINCGNGGAHHGAYGNAYEYRDYEVYNLPGSAASAAGSEPVVGAFINATSRKQSPNPRSDGYGLAFERFKIRGGDYGFEFAHHTLTSSTPTLIINCDIQDVAGKKFLWNEARGGGSQQGHWDIVNSGTPSDIERRAPAVGSTVRMQQGGQAWRITHTGVQTSIPLFYPPVSSFPADPWDLDPALDPALDSAVDPVLDPDPDHHI